MAVHGVSSRVRPYVDGFMILACSLLYRKWKWVATRFFSGEQWMRPYVDGFMILACSLLYRK
jgi:hypothetical protein